QGFKSKNSETVKTTVVKMCELKYGLAFGTALSSTNFTFLSAFHFHFFHTLSDSFHFFFQLPAFISLSLAFVCCYSFSSSYFHFETPWHPHT
ncbi:hypothetical protein VIGAN_03133400, partial [Vigna angularis var. angularis]